MDDNRPGPFAYPLSVVSTLSSPPVVDMSLDLVLEQPPSPFAPAVAHPTTPSTVPLLDIATLDEPPSSFTHNPSGCGTLSPPPLIDMSLSLALEQPPSPFAPATADPPTPLAVPLLDMSLNAALDEPPSPFVRTHCCSSAETGVGGGPCLQPSLAQHPSTVFPLNPHIDTATRSISPSDFISYALDAVPPVSSRPIILVQPIHNHIASFGQQCNDQCNGIEHSQPSLITQNRLRQTRYPPAPPSVVDTATPGLHFEFESNQVASTIHNRYPDDPEAPIALSFDMNVIGEAPPSPFIQSCVSAQATSGSKAGAEDQNWMSFDCDISNEIFPSPFDIGGINTGKDGNCAAESSVSIPSHLREGRPGSFVHPFRFLTQSTLL